MKYVFCVISFLIQWISYDTMNFVKWKTLFFLPTLLFEIKNLKKINRCPCTIEIVTIFTPQS